MRRKLLAGILLLLPAACVGPPEDRTVSWSPSMALAVEAAADRGVDVFVFFHAPWCGVCQRMKAGPLADPAVLRALQAYVPVSVDIDVWPHWAARYGVEAIPMVAIISPSGQIRRQAIGGLETAQLLAFLADRRSEKIDSSDKAPSPAE